MIDPDPADAAIDAHMAAEGSGDVDAMVSTTAEDVAYEFPLQGKRFVGRELARRFYAEGAEAGLRGPGARPRPASQRRGAWVQPGVRIFEVDDHPLLTPDGEVEQHPIAAVIIGRDDGVTHERMYVSDRAFELLVHCVRDDLEPLS